MPFRLDYALWGLSLVVTLARRVNLLFSTDGKYIRMKYATWAIDYKLHVSRCKSLLR